MEIIIKMDNKIMMESIKFMGRGMYSLVGRLYMILYLGLKSIKKVIKKKILC